jgi:hypothetical protein
LLVLSPQTRERPTPTIPTLSQLLRITEEEEFSTLEGENEKPITDLSRSPNSFWLHPNLFLAVAGPHLIRAAEMAF